MDSDTCHARYTYCGGCSNDIKLLVLNEQCMRSLSFMSMHMSMIAKALPFSVSSVIVEEDIFPAVKLCRDTVKSNFTLNAIYVL